MEFSPLIRVMLNFLIFQAKALKGPYYTVNNVDATADQWVRRSLPWQHAVGFQLTRGIPEMWLLITDMTSSLAIDHSYHSPFYVRIIHSMDFLPVRSTPQKGRKRADVRYCQGSCETLPNAP
ncbi:MAG: hypothetical protein IT266_04705 [Saprospiraceae bacterium]|nr:hypothetical protein [Saprospiraceae bacterium]